jgi:hypothetical protein
MNIPQKKGDPIRSPLSNTFFSSLTCQDPTPLTYFLVSWIPYDGFLIKPYISRPHASISCFPFPQRFAIIISKMMISFTRLRNPRRKLHCGN